MKKRTPTMLYNVKQIIETDSHEAANALLSGGNWILVNSYSRRGWMYYVLGRINEYE